jgi:4-hydroxy-tetrahydrodipicolinate synthase
MVAIVTPFKNGKVDEKALGDLIEFHMKSGTDVIVPCGTTGESATLSHEEHHRVVELTVKTVNKRVPVVAGAGSNSTEETLDLAKYARKAGADGVLLITPYYNKPTQEGLYQHFRKVAETCGLPVILYNVPGRTVADLANDTTLRLTQVPGIAGIKDATGDLARVTDLLKRAPRGFAVYGGNDDTALPLMLLGGHGVISVTANVAPRLMSELCKAALAGDLARARAINNQLLPLHFKLFVEANPIPVKWALAKLGRIGKGIRLPLVPLSAANEAAVATAMKEAGLL